MPTHSTELLRTLRRINSLQRERNKLNRRLRAIKKDLKLERKHQRALLQVLEQQDPMTPPMRLFGEITH